MVRSAVLHRAKTLLQWVSVPVEQQAGSLRSCAAPTVVVHGNRSRSAQGTTCRSFTVLAGQGPLCLIQVEV